MARKEMRGTLYEKNGCYVARISYYIDDQRKTKDKSTGIKVDGGTCVKSKRLAKEADRFLAEWMNSFTPPGQRAQIDIKEQLLTNTAKEWLEHQRGLIAPGTLAGYQRSVKDITLYFNTYLPVKTVQLTSAHVEKYLAWERARRQPDYTGDFKGKIMYKDGSGIENTVLHRATALRSILEYAKQTGIIDRNVASKRDSRIAFPNPQRHEFQVLNAEEGKRLLQETVKCELWFQVGITMALLLGLRRSEIFGIKISDIDMGSRILKISRTVTQQTLDGKNTVIVKPFTKNRKPKEFTLSEAFCVLLKELINEHELNRKVFGKAYSTEWDGYLMRYADGKLISPNRLTQKFKWFVEKNGFKSVRLHDLRHSCASILYANGVDLKTIQEILGHTQLTTTLMYTHIINDRKSAALAQMDGLMLSDSPLEGEGSENDRKIDRY